MTDRTYPMTFGEQLDHAFAELADQQRMDTWHMQLFAKDTTNRRVKPLVYAACHRAAFIWRNDTAGCVE